MPLPGGRKASRPLIVDAVDTSLLIRRWDYLRKAWNGGLEVGPWLAETYSVLYKPLFSSHFFSPTLCRVN